MSLRQVLRFSFVFFLVFPFLFLLYEFRSFPVIDGAEVLWAFRNTFIQAAASAVLSLVVGFWGALGLLNFSVADGRRWRSFFEILCLLPNFLPTIFVLLATLNVIRPFPMGLGGIVIVHTIMNFGLVAVILSRLFENKLGGMVELAYIEGVSRARFIFKALGPLLKKDLLLLGLFIFVVCFGSFAVPLVVGGGKGTTVEVLIYEKIRLSSDWSSAFFLALLQSLFIFILSLLTYRERSLQVARPANLRLLRSASGLVVIVLITLLLVVGYLQGLFQGGSSDFDGMALVIFNYFVGSLTIGLGTGILCYICLMLVAYCWSQPWFEKFMNGYMAPSTSLTCFSLLVITSNEGIYPFIKIPVALILLGLNGLFRMGWDGELRSLQSQTRVAYAMGASPGLIFREILFPQLSVPAGFLAGLASIWACGDFAVSRILAHHDLSIAMMTETLMSSYRLSQASLLSLLIIVLGLVCFGFCWGGGYVLRRKFTP